MTNSLPESKHFIVIFLAALVVYSNAIPAAAYDHSRDLKPVIVIDPGHGGIDTGATGPDGTNEKNVTLALARLIKKSLKNKFTVKLTRSGDYWVSLHRRTELANNSQASLFISLHTEGSFIHETSGLSIIYHTTPEEPEAVTENADFQQYTPGASIRTGWYSTHKKYTSASKTLASIILKLMTAKPKYDDARITGLPVAVIAGANMPAIVIETGYLTNPTKESQFNNQVFLSDLADTISLGIETFYDSHPENL